MLTGICFCADCGGAMTIRTGKSGRYRYYTCSTAARQGATGCKGRSIPMEKLDDLVAQHLEERLLDPERLEEVLSASWTGARSAPSVEPPTPRNCARRRRGRGPPQTAL